MKVSTVVRALNRLMPNLRGPNERRRRLYANVVMSVVLYGAPVWGDTLNSSRMLRGLVSLQRSVAQRIISAYRTISGDAASLLARLPPLHLVAPMRKRFYDRMKEHRENGTLEGNTKNVVREEETARMLEEWKRYLERPNFPGEYTKLVLVPRLEAWMSRKHGSMSFHMTQVMTGHGCFSKFLYRIGKRNDTSCDFCGEDTDDVLHTLRECPAWDPERIRLKRALGLSRDFVLGDIVEAILETEEKWLSFSAFVEKVMRDKEDEERRRERSRRNPLPSEEPDSDW